MVKYIVLLICTSKLVLLLICFKISTFNSFKEYNTDASQFSKPTKFCITCENKSVFIFVQIWIKL